MKRSKNDILEISELHLRAFGETEGPVILEMVSEMLAQPETISIDIMKGGKRGGNIIFTPLELKDHPEKKCFLLAPIAVEPDLQGKEIGKELIEEGVSQLKAIDADAIFVLGYPKYYGIRGFYPTWVILPFQDSVTRVDAWKMMELKSGSMAEVGGKSEACKAIMKPMFWDISRGA